MSLFFPGGTYRNPIDGSAPQVSFLTSPLCIGFGAHVIVKMASQEPYLHGICQKVDPIFPEISGKGPPRKGENGGLAEFPGCGRFDLAFSSSASGLLIQWKRAGAGHYEKLHLEFKKHRFFLPIPGYYPREGSTFLRTIHVPGPIPGYS